MTFRFFLQTKGYADNTINAYESHVRGVLRYKGVRDGSSLSIPDVTGFLGEFEDDAICNALRQYREYKLVRAYRDYLVQKLKDDDNGLTLNEIAKCVQIMSQVCTTNRERLYDMGEGVGHFFANDVSPIHNTAINEFIHFASLHHDWFRPAIDR